MYLSLSVPSDRIDVFRAAAAALLAAAAIISLILLISRVQELEAEINSFRLSGGGPAARSSAASAADPTPTPSPTVAVLSAPVLTAQAAEDGVELSWTTMHGATLYELLGVGQCQRLASDWRRRPDRHNLHLHRPRRRHHLFLHHPCSQRRRRNKRMVRPGVHGDSHGHSYACSHGQPTQRFQCLLCGRPDPHSVAHGCRPFCAGVDRAGGRGRCGTQLDHRAWRYALRALGVGQCQRLASDWRRRPHRHNLHSHRSRRRRHLLLHHPCSQRRRRNKRMVRPGVHGDSHGHGHGHTHSNACGHGHTHQYTYRHDRSTQRFQRRFCGRPDPPHRRQRLPPFLCRC